MVLIEKPRPKGAGALAPTNSDRAKRVPLCRRRLSFRRAAP